MTGKFSLERLQDYDVKLFTLGGARSAVLGC